MPLASEIACAGIEPKLTAVEVEDPNVADSWILVDQMTGVSTNTYGSRSTTSASCLYSQTDTQFTSSIEPGTATFDMNYLPDADSQGQQILRDAFLSNTEVNLRYRYNTNPEVIETFGGKVTGVSRPIVEGTYVNQSIDIAKTGQPTYT